jgi:phage terminase small subunit
MGTRSGGRAAKGGLKPLHELFAYRVLEGASAAEAYRRCYPKAKRSTAETNGPALLRSAQVAAFVDERRAKVLAKVSVSAEVKLERVLLELNRILHADPADALDENGAPLPLRDWPEDLRRALAGVEVEEIWDGPRGEREHVGTVHKYKFWNKTAASEQLLRHLGAFKDRLEVDLGAGVDDVTDEEWRQLAALRHTIRGGEGG